MRENGEFTTGHWSWSRRGGGVGVGARLMLKMGLKYTNIWLGFLLRLAVAIMVAIHHYLSRCSCHVVYVDVILLFYALCPPVLLSAISNQLRQQVPLIKEI